jgi:lipopolysaccharide heptosyltransferase II
MSGLQIYARRERALVAAADAALAPLRWFRPSPPAGPPARVLLLRLERIGDLLMTIDAIAAVRSAWPAADIDLAVGSWNRDLAALIPGIRTVLTLDVPWLARGEAGDRWSALTTAARSWRGRYDAVVNFEPDIRTNFLAWLSGTPRRVGYWTGGGGALLTDAIAFDPRAHVSDNSLRLAAVAIGAPPPLASVPARLTLPADARSRAAAALKTTNRPRIGVHVSGGRESKQWHLDRFAHVARRLAEERGATIVLTGSASDRPLVDAVRAQLHGIPVIDVAGALDLPALAGLLADLDVLVTGDTGPMHVASAVGTPIVALFGPADSQRYGPRSPRQRIIRVDLPCSPCGQVRLPPERCRGHVPDCMDGIQVDAVVTAALDLLDSAPRVAQTGVR